MLTELPEQQWEDRGLCVLDGWRQAEERRRATEAGTLTPEWTEWLRGKDDEDEQAAENRDSENDLYRRGLVEVREAAEASGEGVRIYPDGSFEDGYAGWGFVAVKGQQILAVKHGSVVTDPDDPRWKGAQFHSNNAGEVEALVHGLEWAAESRVGDEPVTIIPDSWWAIGAARGAKGRFHRRAATIAAALTTKMGARLGWIKAHSGHQYNEMADAEANAGREEGIERNVDERGQQPVDPRDDDARHLEPDG